MAEELLWPPEESANDGWRLCLDCGAVWTIYYHGRSRSPLSPYCPACGTANTGRPTAEQAKEQTMALLGQTDVVQVMMGDLDDIPEEERSDARELSQMLRSAANIAHRTFMEEEEP